MNEDKDQGRRGVPALEKTYRFLSGWCPRWKNIRAD
jgi:hypothetical protein